MERPSGYSRGPARRASASSGARWPEVPKAKYRASSSEFPLSTIIAGRENPRQGSRRPSLVAGRGGLPRSSSRRPEHFPDRCCRDPIECDIVSSSFRSVRIVEPEEGKEGMSPGSKKKVVARKRGGSSSALLEKTKEVELLHRITESISSNLDLEVVLKEIVGMVVEMTGADACLIYLLNESQKELILRASKNPHPNLIGRVRLELGEGITGWVAKEKRMVAISQNADDDPRFKLFHNLPEDRYQAFL